MLNFLFNMYKHEMMHMPFVLHSQIKLTCGRLFKQRFVYKTRSHVQIKLKKALHILAVYAMFFSNYIVSFCYLYEFLQKTIIL